MKHCHKYFRDNIGIRNEYIVYRCAFPECYHYIQEALIIGRKSVCWRCGIEFVVSRHLNKQTCNACDPVRGNPNFKSKSPYDFDVDLDTIREIMENGED